jgi:hypothetical protein
VIFSGADVVGGVEQEEGAGGGVADDWWQCCRDHPDSSTPLSTLHSFKKNYF